MSYSIADLDPRDSRCWHEGYQWGYLHGVEEGRRRAEAEMAAEWADVARRVRAMAAVPTHAQLCRRRGETEREAVALEHEARVMAS